MKSKIYTLAALAAFSLFLTSCNDDDSAETISGNGSLEVEFDNAFGNDDLILNTQSNTTSNNEVLKISNIKYIVSNIILTKEDGTTYTYPKSENYFVVNEANEDTHVLHLENVPAGDYTKIKFGIGVDEAQYGLGEEGQGDFLVVAQAENMVSGWPAGYKFLTFEGTFTSATVTQATPFLVQTGKTAADYNYTEITLNMPSKALVRTNITPDVHIVADLSKIIDGANKVKLSENVGGEMGAMITGGANIPLITANVAGMFRVDHVHND